jgi:CBS domain-containing protein
VIPSLELQSVGALMTHDPVVASVDLPLADAAGLMDFYRVSGLPVVDREGCLVGVISHTDLLRARTTEVVWDAWSALSVGDLMNRPAVTVTWDTPVDDAAQLMERLGIHRLVVIDADGETPIGVLSVTDLVRSMAERGES